MTVDALGSSAKATETCRANVALICAAPELLAALSDAPNPSKYGVAEAERFYSDYEKWRVEARDIIAKAVGK